MELINYDLVGWDPTKKFEPTNMVHMDDGIKKACDGVDEINTNFTKLYFHNIPRAIPKDITSYYNDGSLWDRIHGRNEYSEFYDIYVGDYFKMSRPISAYERTGQYQTTGSQYVTIASINGLWGNGDTVSMAYNHVVMVPGQGFGGTQHFGRSRMNPSNTTVNGYVGSEMHTTTIGEVTSSGSTASTASINQQLYSEFGSHLQTTRELLSTSINASGYNRLGNNSGCSNSWTWVSCQAVLMSEIEVYGSTVWSSSGYDTGTAKKQLELFAHNTSTLNNRTAYYWLKDVASSAYFCYSYYAGYANSTFASRADIYVRPRFVLS